MNAIEITTAIATAAADAEVTITQVIETEVGTFDGMVFTANGIAEIAMYVQAIARRRYGVEGTFKVVTNDVQIATIDVTRKGASVTVAA